MRSSRLVATLLLLQTRVRMTAEALAAELEVSVRTVYRDIEALGAAGVPVYGSAGKDGGFQLVDGYRTQLTGLAAPEAESLFLMGVPAAAAGLGFREALSAAQLKLLASLPSGQRAKAQRMADRFYLDAPPWYHDDDQPDCLAAIAAAVWAQHRITIDYQRWAAPRHVRVTVEPLGLVLKAGQWYLVARSSGEVRTYRIARVSNLTALDDTFEPPADFDLRAFWHDHLAAFDARRYSGVASLRMSPDVFDTLPTSSSRPSCGPPSPPLVHPIPTDGCASTSPSNPSPTRPGSCSSSAQGWRRWPPGRCATTSGPRRPGSPGSTSELADRTGPRRGPGGPWRRRRAGGLGRSAEVGRRPDVVAPPGG